MKLYIVLSLLILGTCLGNPLSKPENRIFGGENAREGEYPFMVSIREDRGTFHFCGGSIINRRWVLTAAHCTYRRWPEDITIVVAGINSKEPGINYECEQNIWHEKFRFTPGWDIAVLKVTKDFDFRNPLIQSIAIDYSFAPEDTPVTLTGWGNDYALPDGSTTVQNPILQKLKTVVMANSQCGRIVADEMCIRFRPNYNSCNGDSGSPIFNDNNQQIALVSRRNSSPCYNGSPGILTRLTNYKDWIAEHTDSW